MEHLPYSPDLATSDFKSIFEIEKKNPGTHFWTDDNIIHAVGNFLNGQEKKFFKSGIGVP